VNIAAGLTHSCATTPSGELECWGVFEDEAELVDDELISLPEDSSAVFLAVKDGNTCAIDQEGALHCWGSRALEYATPRPIRAGFKRTPFGHERTGNYRFEVTPCLDGEVYGTYFPEGAQQHSSLQIGCY
jgi:hypothetical protein